MEHLNELDLNEPLDILGEQTLLYKLYTQICYCFPVPDASLHPNIILTLTKGLERLSASFPWLAGQIIDKGEGDFRIRPYEKIPHLIIKDLRDDPSIPTWDEIKERNFPFSMLDENIICPRNTLPDPSPGPAPVLMLQLNWLQGGLLLSIVAQHNTMDAVGQGHVIHWLSKACHGETFSEEELSSGNTDRRNIIPLLADSYTPGPELDDQLVKPLSAHPPSPGNDPPPKCSWTYFTFSPSLLSALKAHASKSVQSGFVSTDDVLTAFLWQSVLRVRRHRLSPTDTVRFARAVDARRYLNVADTYPGLCQNMTYHKHSLEELLSLPLGVVASEFRAAVDPKTCDVGFRSRSLATFLSRSRDNKAAASFTASLNLSSDIMLSSWAKVDCYRDDFNFGLGKSVAVRRPQFYAVESLFYLMPKALDGEFAAALCLRDEDLEALKRDDEFMRYAVFVG